MVTDQGWTENPDVLHLARRSNRCTVLGPGVRAVLWVQGCPFRCPGCIVPETLPFEGGVEARVATLAQEIVVLPDIEGVTFSGGEPMTQATALCALIDHVCAKRALSFLSYTGFTLEYLRSRGSSAQQGLLERLDVLIDGPYVVGRHTNLRWRGSDNQRVHFLTGRYRHLEKLIRERGDWIEFEFDRDGSLHWMGIPPKGFREAFEQQMQALGIQLLPGGETDE